MGWSLKTKFLSQNVSLTHFRRVWRLSKLVFGFPRKNIPILKDLLRNLSRWMIRARRWVQLDSQIHKFFEKKRTFSKSQRQWQYFSSHSDWKIAFVGLLNVPMRLWSWSWKRNSTEILDDYEYGLRFSLISVRRKGGLPASEVLTWGKIGGGGRLYRGKTSKGKG